MSESQLLRFRLNEKIILLEIVKELVQGTIINTTHIMKFLFTVACATGYCSPKRLTVRARLKNQHNFNTNCLKDS